jgi:aminoglycoside phosphotransferase (APT) family kinase protein
MRSSSPAGLTIFPRDPRIGPIGQVTGPTGPFRKSKIPILNGPWLARTPATTLRPRAGEIRLRRRADHRTLPGVSAPPAVGARISWEDVPLPVRREIERVCGAPVIGAQTQPGGFSPGVAARVRCADGARWFVKAVSADANPDTPAMHRREARVLADLDPVIVGRRLPVPRLRGTAELGPWFALIIDDVAGRQPVLPWQEEQLDLVLATVGRLAETLTPAPIEAPGIEEYLGADFTGWRRLASGPADGRIDPWSRARLSELAELEATWGALAAGETLLHGDIRADNLLVTGGDGIGGVMVVDWPHVCRGAAFAELVLFAPSVAMQGGPDPAALLARSPLGRRARPDAVRALVCAMAGYFTERSLAPPAPGLPTVRRFQAAQGEVARRWLATLL